MADSRAKLSSRRRRLFASVAGLIVPLALLGGLELGLRLLAYGYRTPFLVGHPRVGADCLVENYRFPWRFFHRTMARYPQPLVVPRTKSPGTCRILVLGESAAMGDPAPGFGFARVLERLLRDRFPATRFEIVNTAFTAISSPVIREIARDCRDLQADFWLVYVGHNEVVGPFGAGTVFGNQAPPRALVRVALALKTTRIGQLADALVQGVRNAGQTNQGWTGMAMLLDQQVRADDPRMSRLYAHYARNLADILDYGQAAGAKVVVSTLTSNLRDCPPFGSLHRRGLSEGQLSAWNEAYGQGVACESRVDLASAIQHYRRAAEADDTFAELHYRSASCQLRLGQLREAQRAFERARDLDTRRFRTDTRLNSIVREVASPRVGRGVRLLDAEREFAQRSLHGVPGEEWFHEHVHFNFPGNYLLARLFADEIAALLPNPEDRAQSVAKSGWLSEQDCALRLGFTQDQAHTVVEAVRSRVSEPPFTGQFGHVERIRRLDERLTQLRRYAKTTGVRQTVEACRQAIQDAPDDWMLLDLLARSLASLNRSDEAAAAWNRVIQLVPHYARTYCELARLAQRQGKTNEAVARFREAMAVNAYWPDALAGLGLMLAEQGVRSEARRHLRAAVRLDPTQAEAAQRLQDWSKSAPQ